MTDEPDESPNGVPTRRQFLTALVGSSLAAAAYGYGIDSEPSSATAAAAESTADQPSQSHIDVLTAVARAVYPSAVSVETSFIRERVFGRIEPKPGHFEELVSTIEAVDSHARARFGDGMTDISAGRRRQVLHSMGVTTVHPTADGTTAERVRFYLLNDLLYVLFTSPKSSDLTGVDNPPGHPGGREAYQRAPGEGDR